MTILQCEASGLSMTQCLDDDYTRSLPMVSVLSLWELPCGIFRSLPPFCAIVALFFAYDITWAESLNSLAIEVIICVVSLLCISFLCVLASPRCITPWVVKAIYVVSLLCILFPL